MTNIAFGIILISLISNLIVGLLSICRKHSRLLKFINISLGSLIIIYFALSYYSEIRNCKAVKEEIISFLKSKHEGYNTKTLSEITEHLRRLDYNETIYSEAITDLIKDKIIDENVYTFYTNIEEYKSYMYRLNTK